MTILLGFLTGEDFASETKNGTVFGTQKWLPNHPSKNRLTSAAFLATLALAFPFGGMAGCKCPRGCVKQTHLKMAA